MIFINPLRSNLEFIVTSKYIAPQLLSPGASIPILGAFWLTRGLRLTEMGYKFRRRYDGAKVSGGVLNVSTEGLQLVLSRTPETRG